MIPRYISVHFWKFRNRWWRNTPLLKIILRDVTLILLGYFLIHSTYEGIYTTLSALEERSGFVPEPTQLLHIIIMSLFGLLLFSNGVTALSSFFLSNDIETLLASPISQRRFFLSKYLETACTSSWMIIVFFIPTLGAFARYYDREFEVALAGLTIIPFLLIPTSIMCSACTLFARICPPKRLKEGAIVVGLLIVAGSYFFLRSETNMSLSEEPASEVIHMMKYLSFTESEYLPTYWFALILSEALFPQQGALQAFSYLMGASFFLLVLCYTIHHSLYSRALFHTQSRHHRTQFKSALSRKRFEYIKKLIPSYYRAIFAKESKHFSRDLAQALQLILILGLCFVYLYNFRIVQRLEIASGQTREWWQAFLILSNIFLGGLITTAVSARFVFPTLSLEGKSYWLLRSAPLTLTEILQAKFWFWFIPLSTISTVIFTSGAFAIQAKIDIVTIHALCSWILSYGIVGMAIGLGAFFSDFEWEHSAQITASFGNFVYMIASTCLVIVLMIPISLLIILHTLRVLEMPIPITSWYIAIIGCAFLICYINHSLTKWCLRIGANALRQKV